MDAPPRSPTTGLIAGQAPTDSDSGANAAADNSNVAGWSVDDNNVIQPVIWTCAVQQAYEP